MPNPRKLRKRVHEDLAVLTSLLASLTERVTALEQQHMALVHATAQTLVSTQENADAVHRSLLDYCLALKEAIRAHQVHLTVHDGLLARTYPEAIQALDTPLTPALLQQAIAELEAWMQRPRPEEER